MANQEIREILCGQRRIKYQYVQKNVKNINLRIKPNGEIMVSANETVPLDYVDEFVKRKQSYIFDALDKYEISHRYISMENRRYVSGESYYLLGKSLRLKIFEGKEESIYTDGVFIYLTVQNTDDFSRKEFCMKKWLLEVQEKFFTEICDEIYHVFQKYGVKYPIIKIRYMKARWGSCYPEKGIVTLNSKLIEVPRNCVEYVVLHEFVHFIHRNHSNEFYDFMTMIMPDWKVRKQELEKKAQNL